MAYFGTPPHSPTYQTADGVANRESRLSLDDWLPITASRNAKWWYSAFHNVTAIVGAGVLSFPSAMKYLGWGFGTVVLVLSWVITLFTLWQMVEMHEMVPNKRFDRYHELGQYAFGPKLGLWIMIPQQLIIEVGTDIVYMVIGGQSLMQFYTIVCAGKCHFIGQQVWILIFASVHFILAQLPSFNSIAGVSFLAAVMSLGYSTIAWTSSLSEKVKGAIEYKVEYTKPHENDTIGMLNALGQIAFAYAAHNVALEIQATIPSTPEKPSKGPMWRGVLVAYAIVAFCYFPVAFVGYWAFGNKVQDDILTSLDQNAIAAVAHLLVVIHMIGSYQLYAMPVFDMMETLLVKKLHFSPTLTLRLIVRSTYVAFTCLVAICIPFFGALLGFFGGFAFSPLTYFLPCVIWLIVKKPKVFSTSWFINWILIILGVLLLIASTIGGLLKIKISIERYKVFSSNSTTV